ncbi:MAG: glycosyltransferase family 39 protein [Candidatus Omnitrophica bacterium]|nr:glycosyltransferase family 39 protein [Candidatus Omnitrophota bacterium]
MIDILLFLAIVLISYGIGKRLLNLAVKDADDLVQDFIFSTGLGFGIIGYAVYALGSIGLLYLGYVVTALLVCALFSFYPVVQFIRRINWSRAGQWIAGLSGFEKFLLAVPVTIAAVCIFGANAPEIGNDALAYHLYHPKIFIQNHKIGYVPFTRESLWPYLTEMLFTIGLLLKSVSVAKMFHFFFGVLSALSVYSFIRRFFGRREALLACALFSSAPGIFMQSVYSYVDLSLCFYSFAALYSMILWTEKSDTKYVILAGIFTGLALSVKLMGGLTFITLACTILYHLIVNRADLKRAFKIFAIFVGAAAVVSSIWYIRSYVATGNPIYPFLYNIFKKGWPDSVSYVTVPSRGIIEFIRLPWDLVMNMDNFGGEQIGILSLVLLPVLLFLPFKKRVIKYMLIFSAIYTIAWYTVTPNIRFAFVNFAVVYSLIGIGFCAASKRYSLGVLKIILSLCILFNVCLCFYYNKDSVKLGLGLIGTKDYLYKKEGSYPVAEFVNKNLPAESIVISLVGTRWFYFDREIIDYSIWNITSKESFSNYLSKLKKRGPVFLLLNENTELNDYEEIRTIINNRAPIFNFSIKVGDGKVVDHYVYKI